MTDIQNAAFVSGLISFLFGGGIIAWFKYYRDNKIEDRTFAESEREKMKTEIQRLTETVSAMSARLIPSNLPNWIKDANRKYIDVNSSWEIQIGARLGKYRSDVIGKTDEQVFSGFPEFAKIMHELDDIAISNNGFSSKSGIVFPLNPDHPRMVISQIVTHDILGQLVFKAMAIPEKKEN